MRKILGCICMVCMITLCACQADQAVAQYQYNQTVAPTLAPSETEVPTKEIDGTLFDVGYNRNVIENGYDAFCRDYPDKELEQAILKSEPTYLILSNSETSQVREFLDKVMNNLYVANYLTYDEDNIEKDRVDLFSKNIFDSIGTLRSQSDIVSKQKEYKLTLDVSNVVMLNYNFVSKFADTSGNILYRVWVQFPLRIMPTENNKLFFEMYPQYYKGDNNINLWIYVKVPDEKSSKMEVVAMTEIMDDESSVSIYQGVSSQVEGENPTTIFDENSTEYVKDVTIESQENDQIVSMVRNFETTLYSGDSSTITKDQLEKTIYPLCTQVLQQKLSDNKYFENYAQEIADTDAKLTASLFSPMIEKEMAAKNPDLLVLQQFVLPDDSIVYLYSENWLGGLESDADFSEEFGLKRSELQGGRRQYTCYYLLENVDGIFRIAAFKISETGEGESNSTGQG